MRILYNSVHATYLHLLPSMYNIDMPKGIRKDGTRLGFQKGHVSPLRGKVLKTRIFKICACGNGFSLSPGRIREKHGKYCSRSCYYKYRINFDVSALSHEKKGKGHWAFRDNAKYSALHLRVQKKRGKATICIDCNSTNWVEWASISKHYEDINDYKPLCRKCHNKFDNIGKRASETRRKTLQKASMSDGSTEGRDVSA